MSNQTPMYDWSFHYCRLRGSIEHRGRVLTSPVVSIEETPEGEVAITKSGSRYLLMECEPTKSRDEWIEVWKYWEGAEKR